MTTGAAQGGSATAAAEPTTGHDGFTDEERSQFEQMQKGESGTPEPAAGEGDQAGAGGAEKPADQQKQHEKPAAAAGAEPGDDDDDEAKPGEEKQSPRRVNYNKFARMEDRAKKAETELATTKENFARLDERIKLLNEALTPQERAKQEEEDPEPDPEKDIFGWVNWSRRKIAVLEQNYKGMQQGQQASQEEVQIANSYIDDARTFQSTEPNFAHAYQWLMANRTYELAQYFFGKDLAEEGASLNQQEANRIKQAIAAEERDLVAEALKSGQSPAKRIFGLARARGFRPQASAAGGAQQQNGAAQTKPGQQNGQAAPGSLAAKPNVADEIGRIRKGSEAALSLSQGGGAPAGALTPERLVNMSQEEFDAIVDRLTPTQQRAIFGN